MKKVLIITYYWPPTGGSGVQRWLKMSKYLPEYGWHPVIYTPENPESGIIDNSLQKDIHENLTVVKTKIKEPFEIYKKITGRKKGEMIGTGFLSEKKSDSFAEKLSVWIRGNIFIPDARMLWIKPSVKFLTSYLKKKPVDLIVSTGPPHSMHLIALKVSKKLSVPWIADFRDPWTGIDFYHQLKLTRFADNKHKKLEKQVLKNAGGVITVNRTLASDLEKISGRKVDVVTNGFDPDDYLITNNNNISDKFLLCHLGSMNKDRNHEIFWRALKELKNEIPGFANDLHMELIGATDYSVREIVKEYNLDNNVNYIKFAGHQTAINKAAQAQVLYLPLNNTPNAKGITPTKFFEYLAIRRPVLCIGPEDGDAAVIINETGCGIVAGFENYNKVKSALVDFYNQYKNRGEVNLNCNNINNYSRKIIAGKVAALFEKSI